MKRSFLLMVALVFLVGCAAKKRTIVIIDEPVKEEVVVEVNQEIEEQTVMLEDVAPMPVEEEAVVEEVEIKESVTTYVTAPNDNLYNICLEKDLFIWQLADLNGIKNPRIIPVGKQLKIPAEKKKVVSSGNYYKVDIGDYLSRIAGEVDKSQEELADLNNLANVNRIEAGSLLKVK